MTELEQHEKPRYCTLLYDVRKKLDISCVEYVLLDMIHKLSYKTGYCYKTPQLIADDLGITKRGVNKMILRLCKKGLIERLTASALRVTDVYLDSSTSGNKVPEEFKKVGTKFRKWELSSASGNKVPKKQGSRITKNNNRITKNTTNVVLPAKQPQSYGRADINEIFAYWEETIGYKITSQIKNNRYAVSTMLKTRSMDEMKRIINGVALAQEDQYHFAKFADFVKLQYNLNSLLAWGNQRNKNQNNGRKVFRI